MGMWAGEFFCIWDSAKSDLRLEPGICSPMLGSKGCRGNATIWLQKGRRRGWGVYVRGGAIRRRDATCDSREA